VVEAYSIAKRTVASLAVLALSGQGVSKIEEIKTSLDYQRGG
jgi:hypothetical protein